MKFAKFLIAVGGMIVILFFLLSSAGFNSPTPSRETDLTMAKYLEIKTGMSYVEVVAILASPGEELSRVDIADTTTVMYAWRTGIGTNMNATFQSDKLVSKAQFGLQ